MQVLSKLRKDSLLKFLAVCLAVFLFLQLPLSVLDVSAASQSELDELNEEYDALQAKKNDLQSQIEALEASQSTNLAKKELLDEQVAVTQQQIDAANEQIAQYVTLIKEKQIEIADLEQKEAEQLELYKERVRIMEENGSVSYYSILFGASSFSDLLARLDFIDEIMNYDEMVYNEFVEAREATQAAKAELEATKAEQEAKKAELETLRAELDGQINEISAVLSEIESNISEYESLVNEADEEAENVQAEINRIEEELAAQQAANQGTNNNNNISAPVYSGDGTYIWPTASKYITSPYGMRLHPILGYYRYHSGVDIGGGGGNPVLAAAAGTVIISQWSDSYGYYVVINHGNSTTLYAHMSCLKVSVGQYVNQGDIIGNVGTTGLSTGYHLHFEISVNGSRIDPLTQFSSGQWIRSW